jgi:hypothetical protein
MEGVEAALVDRPKWENRHGKLSGEHEARLTALRRMDDACEQTLTHLLRACAFPGFWELNGLERRDASVACEHSAFESIIVIDSGDGSSMCRGLMPSSSCCMTSWRAAIRARSAPRGDRPRALVAVRL